MFEMLLPPTFSEWVFSVLAGMNRYISLNIIFNDSQANESLLFTNNIIM